MARAFRIVKQRCQELLRLNIEELKEMGLRTPAISFQPHPQHHQPRGQEEGDGEMVNVVGQLMVNEEWNQSAPASCQPDNIGVETWSLADDDDDDDDDDDEQTGEGMYIPGGPKKVIPLVQCNIISLIF